MKKVIRTEMQVTTLVIPVRKDLLVFWIGVLALLAGVCMYLARPSPGIAERAGDNLVLLYPPGDASGWTVTFSLVAAAAAVIAVVVCLGARNDTRDALRLAQAFLNQAEMLESARLDGPAFVPPAALPVAPGPAQGPTESHIPGDDVFRGVLDPRGGVDMSAGTSGAGDAPHGAPAARSVPMLVADSVPPPLPAAVT